MEKMRRTVIQLITCVALLAIIWGGYAYGAKKIGQIVEKVLEDDFSWVAQVDEIRTEEDTFVLEGFAFKLGQNSEGAFDIVLHNLETDEYLFPKMEFVDRDDVNEYFLCEYDYKKSGFVARIKRKKLNLEENDYEVLLRPRNSKDSYQFTTYLSDGKLLYVNPKEYVPLDVSGSDLEEIVEKGVLRVYEPRNHIYVYQYEKKLYWIADAQYNFEEDGSTYIDFQMNTTQPEKLPKERIESGCLWGNEGFVFERNENIDFNANSYRCAVYAIPTDYSVIKMWTGYYTGKWDWVKEFRPRYDWE